MAEERKKLKEKIADTDSMITMLNQMSDREKEGLMMFCNGMRAARELYQPTTEKQKPAQKREVKHDEISETIYEDN